MYLSRDTIIDSVSVSNSVQNVVGSIEECACVKIMAWLDPLGFKDSPQRLGDIQMRRVRRKVEDIEAAQSLFLNHLLRFAACMEARIVKNDEGWPCDCQRELVDKIRHILSLDALTACKALIDIVPAYHAENIESGGFHWRHKVVLPGKLPSIRGISLCVSMALVSEVKVNESLITEIFKFLQLLALNCIELWRGCYPWASGDRLIYCAKTSIKRLKVMSIAVFPEAFSHSSLADSTLCRSRNAASRTNVSSEQFIICLRLCPGFVFNPLMPSLAYLFVQLKTESVETSSFWATSSLDSFSLWRSIARQRTRNLWSDPCLYPASNCRRSSSVSNIYFFLAIILSMRWCHITTY